MHLLKRRTGHIASPLNRIIKDGVANTADGRETNRFLERSGVKDSLKCSVDSGIVAEIGEGDFEKLCFSKDIAVGTLSFPLSDELPISEDELPQKVTSLISLKPFVLFVAWKVCKKGETVKGEYKPFVHPISKGLIFRSKSLSKVQQSTM